MAAKRFVTLATLGLALFVGAGCTSNQESFGSRLQQATRADPPESLTDCAKSTVRRPPVIAAVAGGVQGVAVAAGARLAVCAVRVSRSDAEETEEADAISRGGTPSRAD